MARHIRPRGFDVILEDLEPGRLEEALRRVRGHIDLLVKAGLGEDPEGVVERIEAATDLEEAVGNADYAQGSIIRELRG
jgi:3-hydroxyacyl-CoA dehydrogenase